jgi:hypothetical protein
MTGVGKNKTGYRVEKKKKKKKKGNCCVASRLVMLLSMPKAGTLR